MEPKGKEENLTLIVAAAGLLFFILLAIALCIPWNAANPPLEAPVIALHPAAINAMTPVPKAVPPEDSRHNVTEMYLLTHKSDLLRIPQNLSDPYEANYVPKDTARMHAAIEMARLMPVNASGDFPTYGPPAVPGTDPTLVFDEVTGKLVSFDFYSAPSSSGRAFVTVSANRLWGNSVFRAGFTYQENEQMNLEKAQGYYDRNFSGYNIQSVRFVYGCWGKIVQIKMANPDSHEITVNMDYWGIVGERRCGSGTGDIPAREIPSRIAAWEKRDAEYQDLAARLHTAGVNLSNPVSPDDPAKIHHILN